MKFVRYGEAGQESPAVLTADGTYVDISPIVVDLGPDTLAQLPEIVEAVASRTDLARLNPGDRRIGSPIARPHKIIGIGLNYADHAAESGAEVPREPVVFMKATSSLSGPNDDVVFPPGATKMDWEVELGVVLGRTARYLADEAEVQGAIGGYVIGNDVSERAFQLEREGQWMKGKSADTFTPVGPWLVTPDEVGDVLDLELRLSVNGVIKQHGSTEKMVFSPAYCIYYISQFMTLEPGDLVLTGTPPGVGLSSGEYLRPGDVMEVEIQGLGSQIQTCRQEERP